ncbi:MAG: SURF1 family protein [Rhodoferax sp.]|nr:SURF1 family protein [Rhodoferax sp.]
MRLLIVSAAALLGVALTAALGFWQLGRASQKLELQSTMDQRAQLAPLDSAELLRDPAQAGLLHRRVTLRGTWLDRHTVFLDNRQMNAKPGFYVVTPLRLNGSSAVVVVQRGWVQRSFLDRTQIPALPTDAGLVQIEGRIAPPPSKLYAFTGPDGGPIRQNLDMDRFASEIGAGLLPFSVQQTGPGADVLLRDWPRIHTGVEKHYGYAFQWFALCALIAILYGWFQIVRRVSPRP